MARAPRRSADRAQLRRQACSSAPPVKRAAVLTAPQIAALLAAAAPRDRALVALMTAGALRVGEATLLTWQDVADGVVTIPGSISKTGRGRFFSLPAEAGQHLQTWQLECPPCSSGWIFPGTPIANPLSVRGAQAAINRLAGQLGFKGVSSHSFRRSALTAAHQAGLSLREVAEISGHASLAALERYLDQDAARARAEAARGLLFAAS